MQRWFAGSRGSVVREGGGDRTGREPPEVLEERRPGRSCVEGPGQGGQGQPGQQSQGGTNSCCYNGTAYDCPDVNSCLGGFDLQACQAACANGDFRCQIDCAEQVSNITGPTNACKQIGQCQ